MTTCLQPYTLRQTFHTLRIAVRSDTKESGHRSGSDRLTGGQDISPGRQTAWNDAENSASLQTFASRLVQPWESAETRSRIPQATAANIVKDGCTKLPCMEKTKEQTCVTITWL
eukprot:1169239-Amphidinium_carterae.1